MRIQHFLFLFFIFSFNLWGLGQACTSASQCRGFPGTELACIHGYCQEAIKDHICTQRCPRGYDCYYDQCVPQEPSTCSPSCKGWQRCEGVFCRNDLQEDGGGGLYWITEFDFDAYRMLLCRKSLSPCNTLHRECAKFNTLTGYMGETCLPSCVDGYYWDNATETCVNNCLHYNEECVDSCPADTHPEELECIDDTQEVTCDEVFDQTKIITTENGTPGKPFDSEDWIINKTLLTDPAHRVTRNWNGTEWVIDQSDINLCEWDIEAITHYTELQLCSDIINQDLTITFTGKVQGYNLQDENGINLSGSQFFMLYSGYMTDQPQNDITSGTMTTNLSQIMLTPYKKINCGDLPVNATAGKNYRDGFVYYAAGTFDGATGVCTFTTPEEVETECWVCNDGFHQEDNLCEPNTQQVNCKDVAPANATSTIELITINWNETTGWETAPNCNWSCNSEFHQVNDNCESNTQQVNCTDVAPTNATSTITQVTINWSESTGWETAANCSWSCDSGFHTEDNSTCISNTKTVQCSDNSPANATAIVEDVLVTWNGTGWSSSDCSWNCNIGYHKEDATTCAPDIKTESCTDAAPTNAQSVVKDVLVRWNGESWDTPAVCDWNCVEGYVLTMAEECVLKTTEDSDKSFTELRDEELAHFAGEQGLPLEFFGTDPVLLRGRVLTSDQSPLNGVAISFHNNDTLIASGKTILTNSRGYFSLVIPRNTPLTLEYRKEGFLTIQRPAYRVECKDVNNERVCAQNHDHVGDTQFMNDVIMLQQSPHATTIELGGAENNQIQETALTVAVPENQLEDDGAGKRQARILFPQGTTIFRKDAAGNVTPISGNITVRTTEYTNGVNGLGRMPADLGDPARAAYTYAVELGIDEADGDEVIFRDEYGNEKDVMTYVENFIGFPIGAVVPSGVYNFQEAKWVPSKNGLVIGVTDTDDDGYAEVCINDSDFDGTCDSDAIRDRDNLGEFTIDELQKLVAYKNQTIWRIPVKHFSSYDFNWPLDGMGRDPRISTADCDDCIKPGSIIHVQDQVLGEKIPLANTGIMLHYKSDRTMDYKPAFEKLIHLYDKKPENLKMIRISITVAGERKYFVIPEEDLKEEKQRFLFQWDRKGYYYESVYAAHLDIRISFYYEAKYSPAGEVFGMISSDPTGSSWANVSLLSSSTSNKNISVVGSQRMGVDRWQRSESFVGTRIARHERLGGWQLSIHHTLAPRSKKLFLGTGEVVDVRGKIFSRGAALTQYSDTGHYKIDDYDVIHNGYVYRFSRYGKHLTTREFGTNRLLYTFDYSVINNQYKMLTKIKDHTHNEDITITPDINGTDIDISANGRTTKLVKDTWGRLRSVTLYGDQIYNMDYKDSTALLTKFKRPIKNNTRLESSFVYDDQGRLTTDYNNEASQSQTEQKLSHVNVNDGTNDQIIKFKTAMGRETIFHKMLRDGEKLDQKVELPGITNNRFRFIDYNNDDDKNQKISEFFSESGLMIKVDQVEDNFRTYHSDEGTAGPIGMTERTTTSQTIDYIGRSSSSQPINITTTIEQEVDDEASDSPLNPRFITKTTQVTDTGGYSYGYSKVRYDVLNRVIEEINCESNQENCPGKQRSKIHLNTEHQIAKILFPEMVESNSDTNGTVKFDYYTDTPGKTGKVSSITVTGLNGKVRYIEYDYIDSNNGYGKISSIKIYNYDGQLAKTLSYAYDDHDRLEEQILPDERRVVFQYDNHNNITSIKTPHYNGSPHNEHISHYNDSGQETDYCGVDSACDPNNTTTYSYNYDHDITGITLPNSTNIKINYATGIKRIDNITVDNEEKVKYHYYSDTGNLKSISGNSTGVSQGIEYLYPEINCSLDENNNYFCKESDCIDGDNCFQYADIDVNGVQCFSNCTSYHSSCIAECTPEDTTCNKDCNDSQKECLEDCGKTNYPAYASLRHTLPQKIKLTGSLNKTMKIIYDRVAKPVGFKFFDDSDIPVFYAVQYNDFRDMPVGAQASFSYVENSGSYGYTRAVNMEYTYNDVQLLQQIKSTGYYTFNVSFFDEFGYNQFREMNRYTVTQGDSVANGGTILFQQDFIRNYEGLITQQLRQIYDITTDTTDSANLDYEFNNRGQLIAVRKNGTLIEYYSYSFDGKSNGNRVNCELDSYNSQNGCEIKNGETFEFNAQDQATKFRKNSYTYNLNGYVEGCDDIEGNPANSNECSFTSLTYDHFGNLTAAESASGTLFTYVTDPLNRRIGKKIGDDFVYKLVYKDQLNPIVRINSDGTEDYFLYASKRHVPDYMYKKNTNTLYRIITDHIGSVVMVVDRDGNPVQKITYDTWGAVLTDSNPGFQPFYFAGGLYDQDTKLLRFGARDYDPYTGRWTAKDPIRFKGGTTNLYGYCSNDPVNFVDVNGLRRKYIEGTTEWLETMLAMSKLAGVGIGIMIGVSVGLVVSSITVGILVGFLGNEISHIITSVLTGLAYGREEGLAAYEDGASLGSTLIKIIALIEYLLC